MLLEAFVGSGQITNLHLLGAFNFIRIYSEARMACRIAGLQVASLVSLLIINKITVREVVVN